MSSIFVSIANYRDFETLNTVRELLDSRYIERNMTTSE